MGATFTYSPREAGYLEYIIYQYGLRAAAHYVYSEVVEKIHEKVEKIGIAALVAGFYFFGVERVIKGIEFYEEASKLFKKRDKTVRVYSE